MAFYTKVINIIMTDEFTPTKKINFKPIILALVFIIISSYLLINIDDKINLEEITIEQLEEIPNIGPKRAIAIFEYINSEEFNDYDDLLILEDVGEETIKALKRYTKK